MQARGPNPEKAGWGGPKGGGSHLEKVGARRVGARRVGAEGWGPKPRKSGGPKGGGPKGGGPKGGGPKFLAFFSLSRHKIRSFLLSLGVFSWNFGGV